MKISHENCSFSIEVDNGFIHSLIIENTSFLYSLVNEFYNQIDGYTGKILVSEKYTPLDISRNVELLTSFFPIELNKKTIQTKLISTLGRFAFLETHSIETYNILQELESYMSSLSMELPFDIVFTKIDIGSIIKALAPEICSDASTLSEMLLHYFEIVRQFEGDKLFVLLNYRSFVSDEEAQAFFDTIVSHQYKILLLENMEHSKLNLEKHHIIDSDLCEI